VPLALLSYPSAKIGWLLLNLLAVAAVVAMTAHTVNRLPNGKWDHLGTVLLAAFIMGSPLTTNVVWLGQTTLIVFAATMAAWFFNRQGRWVLAGVCLGLATVKPQVCLLVFVWLLLERQWKPLLVSVGAAAVLALYPMLVQGGPFGVAQAWLDRLQSHKAFEANMPGSEHVIGVTSFLNAAGLNAPGLEAVGVALVVVLWLFRDRIDPEDVFGILMGLMVSFVFVHDCEYVCLVPLVTSLWVHGRERWATLFWGGLLVLLLLFPRRLVRALDVPVLSHWRTLVALLILGTVVVLSVRRRSGRPLRERAPDVGREALPVA
jgi:hypothetical protein